MAEKPQNDWIQRVLGVAVDPDAPAGPRAKLLPIWVGAKETVDDGISKLQDALREWEDDDLDTIVEFGLYGATSGESVELMAALRDADGKGTVGAYARVIDAVTEFREFLDGAPIVNLIESNPFGVTVPLRATLGPALAEIAKIAA